MINQNETKEIKNITEELLQKMTMDNFNVELKSSLMSSSKKKLLENGTDLELGEPEAIDIIDVSIKIKEPQILIGQNGQTLLGLERILRIILSKKLKKTFYLKLDINDYKKKKIEYLKELARESANEVSLTKKKKILSPMPAHERLIIHTELAQRQDIITESQGEGSQRYIVISPR